MTAARDWRDPRFPETGARALRRQPPHTAHCRNGPVPQRASAPPGQQARVPAAPGPGPPARMQVRLRTASTPPPIQCGGGRRLPQPPHDSGCLFAPLRSRTARSEDSAGRASRHSDRFSTMAGPAGTTIWRLSAQETSGWRERRRARPPSLLHGRHPLVVAPAVAALTPPCVQPTHPPQPVGRRP